MSTTNILTMPNLRRTRKPNARVRGQGSLLKRGAMYWMELTVKGVRYRQSLETSDKETAILKITAAVAAIRSGELPKTFEPVSVQSLYDIWISEVERTCKPRTLADYKSRWVIHLEPFFGNLRATQVTKDKVASYLLARKREGAGDITQNRENRVLRMIFSYNRKKISANDFPEFPEMHSEKNRVRKGRLSVADYQTLLTRLEDPNNFWLKVIIVMTYHWGFRKGELLNARCVWFNSQASTFTLPSYSTKNKTERRITIRRDGEIYKMLVTLTEGRNPEASLFVRNGKPVRDYRTAWEKITEGIRGGSGIGGSVTIHDLRRSAITNMSIKGVTADQAATHLTPDVFRRYITRSEQEEQHLASVVEGE